MMEYLNIAHKIEGLRLALKTSTRRFVQAQFKDIKTYHFWRSAVAEFIGTLWLGLFIAGSGCVRQDSNPIPDGQSAFVIVCVLTAIIAGMFNVSGANLNPAVSMMMALTNRMTASRAIVYSVWQCMGVGCSRLLLHQLFPSSMTTNLGVLKPAKDITSGQAFSIEIATPENDVCAKCEMLRKKVSDARTDDDKLQTSMDLQQHVLAAKMEHQVYKTCVANSKDELRGSQPPDTPAEACSQDYAHVHYTFDFSQNVAVPHHVKQMGPMYFVTPRKLIIGFIIGFLCLSLFDPRRKDNWGAIPLVFGLCIASNYLFTAAVTPVAMNPAFSVGPMIVYGDIEYQWIYILGPILGILGGAVTFDLFFSEDISDKWDKTFFKRNIVQDIKHTHHEEVTPLDFKASDVVKKTESQVELCSEIYYI